MLKIMSLGNCTCEGWQNSAQNISDRIVSSTATGMNVYEGPMFDFCPYCGRKLVQVGVGPPRTVFWGGNPISEYNHKDLIDIIEQMGIEMSDLRNKIIVGIERIRTGTV